MKRYATSTKRLLLCLSLMAVSLATTQAAWSQNEGKMDILFDRFLDQFKSDQGRTIANAIKFHEVGGVSVVMMDGVLPFKHRVWGHRDVGRDLPTTKETTYQAASLSKMVAGLTIAAAHRRGDVRINRSVDRFAELFPESIVGKWRKQAFKREQMDWADDITLSRLLSSSAGLDTHGIGHFGESVHCNSVENIILGNIATAKCNGVKPIRRPGIMHLYSGGGYTVAEAMLETETGQSFKGYAARHVLEPYGMNRSTFDDASTDMNNLARGCSRGKCKKDKVLELAPKAAGGLLAHPMDYARLIHLMMYDGKDAFAAKRLSDAPQVIPVEDIEQVLRPSSHIDSTFARCKTSCPARQDKIWRNGIPTVGQRPEVCYKLKCRENLSETPGDFTDSWYGLGVELSQVRLDDGLSVRFSHGGDQDGFSHEFRACRDQKAAMIVFVNGELLWENDAGSVRGAAVLAQDIIDAWQNTTGC